MAMNVPLSSSQALSSCKLFHGSNKPPQASRSPVTMNLQAKFSHFKAKGYARSTRLPREKLEIFESPELTSWAEENYLTMLKSVEGVWQPQDLLPDPASEGFIDTVKELRNRAAEIPDEYLVCLIGNMITEEALPSYLSGGNTVDGFRDETGVDPTPWAMWIRMWTGEENRHGDVLNKYLYLSGRCDMKQIERTIQNLLGAGMDTGCEKNPFAGVIYTSFQERATFISHGNTARHAKRHGDATLAKICGLIAADEKRHELAYTKLADKLFRVDPDSMMRGFAAMMRKRITMPARLMFDGRDRSLFDHFSAVSQRMGVYTARDYVEMVEFFVERWRVEEVTDLSPEGRKAQDYVCGLAERFRRMEERAEEKNNGKQRHSADINAIPFSWISDRKVAV